MSEEEEQTMEVSDTELSETDSVKVTTTPPIAKIKVENEEPKNKQEKSNGKSEEEEPTTGDSGVSSPGDQKPELNSSQLTVKKKEPEDSPESPPPPDSPEEDNDGEEITPDVKVSGKASSEAGSINDEDREKETKPTLGGISVRKSAELLASPGASFSNMASLVHKNVSNGEFNPVNSPYACSVCPERFASGPELESHMAASSHYVCSFNNSQCASIGFSSAAELAAHQAQAHQGPVQQLAQQVERLPASYSASHQSYQNQQPTPAVQIYPSYQNQRPPPHIPLGSQVMLTPVGPTSIQSTPSLPNLPGIQVTKRTAPAPVETPSQPKQRREDSTPSIRLPDSITLVKPSSMATAQPAAKKDTVADLLATRGITVLPSSGAARSAQPAPTSPARRLPATTSQLNSSVSITPSSRQRFAVPRGRSLPTVDLTQEADNTRAARRPAQRRLACQICDKVFLTTEALNAHVNTHRTQSKIPYECELCTAQYPTEQGLANHRLKFHGRRPQVSSTSMDMALPVVDIRQAGVKEKLLQVGVRHVLMLSQLHNRAGTASFGLPIVPVDLANNQAFCSLGDMGVSNLLPLGALQSLR